jgi:hypothetical protein
MACIRIGLFWVFSIGAFGGPLRPAPTFTRDIAPILYQNCVLCHRAGEVAPFSLLTYQDAAKRAALIAEVTRKRIMPPWRPDDGPVPFRHARRLTDGEIDVLQRWASAGAPQGVGAGPAEPQFPQGWQAGQPNLVVSTPATNVPADGPDIWRCLVIHLNFHEDRYVSAVEFRPGTRRVVHHALLYLDTSGKARKLDEETPEPGYECYGGPRFVPNALLAGWTPGLVSDRLPSGTAQKIPRGADLIIQIHYHPSGKAEQDQSSLGLSFTSRPEHEMAMFVKETTLIDIPAGEAHHEIRQKSIIPADADVIGIAPHAHYLCKEMTVEARLPEGSIIPLIHIGDWDFNWQGIYWYEKPVHLPAGTQVIMRYVYDNSEANPRNPHHPPQRVRFGYRTTDEMALLVMPTTVVNAVDSAKLRYAGLLSVLEERLKLGDLSQMEESLPRFKFLVKVFDTDHDGTLDATEQQSLLRFIEFWISLTTGPHWPLIRFTGVASLFVLLVGSAWLVVIGAMRLIRYRSA